jgi:hypothetical protein
VEQVPVAPEHGRRLERESPLRIAPGGLQREELGVVVVVENREPYEVGTASVGVQLAPLSMG